MSFFAAEPLNPMISSRCKDQVPFGGRPQTMAAVRRAALIVNRANPRMPFVAAEVMIEARRAVKADGAHGSRIRGLT